MNWAKEFQFYVNVRPEEYRLVYSDYIFSGRYVGYDGTFSVDPDILTRISKELSWIW